MSEFESPEDQPRDRAKWVAVGLVVVSSAFAVLYKTAERTGFGHTSVMFLGIPAVLAILLALLPRAKSATGAILKGITFALLIVAPLLGEGYLCILIASPLFYVVGLIVGAAVDWNRKKRGITLSCCALVLLPLALEGVVPQLTYSRLETVADRECDNRAGRAGSSTQPAHRHTAPAVSEDRLSASAGGSWRRSEHRLPADDSFFRCRRRSARRPGHRDHGFLSGLRSQPDCERFEQADPVGSLG